MSEPGSRRGHAFISYVHEDAPDVDELERALESVGVQVWRDTSQLWPGDDWRAKIRQAITGDALVFIACFSHNSLARQVSYQNEEITLAIEQMRLRPPEVPWLIPVRLSDCQIPDRDIGGGRTLGSIQRADLFGVHREDSIARVVEAVRRLLDGQEQSWENSYRQALAGDGDLYLQGISLHAIITESSDALVRRLKRGFTVRALLTDPDSPASRIAAERSSLSYGVEGIRSQIESSLYHLAALKGFGPGRLQVRLTCQALNFAAIVIRPDSHQAVMFVQYYVHHQPQDGMQLILRSSDGQAFFKSHLTHMDALWDGAMPWT